MKQQILQKVRQYIDKHQMIEKNDTILLGVSGGADSICLLSILETLYKNSTVRISVVHIDHKMRITAKDDALFVENYCKSRDIPFYLEEVEMENYAREHHLSCEEAGRELRYQKFMQIASQIHATKIGVAHHADDQAETVLFHMFRGSGLKGLCGMEPVRDQIIRPLLCLTRKEIELYLEAMHIPYCNDETNDQDDYTRNRIRHHILPYAEQSICKGSTLHIAETAERMRRTFLLINELTKEAYAACVLSEQKYKRIEVSCEKLFLYPDYLQEEILLYILEQMTPCRKDISSEHVRLIRNVLMGEGEKKCSLPEKIEVIKQYDKLLFQKKEDKDPINYYDILVDRQVLEKEKEAEYKSADRKILSFKLIQAGKNEDRLPYMMENQYTKWFDYDKISASIKIRTRRQGDYFICNRQGQKKLIKDFMINEKIPKEKRDTLYLVAVENHIIWIPEYRISEAYKVDQKTKCILQIHLEEENDGRTC